MGFFSWRTQDTDRSIANNYSNRKTFTVVMIDNKGNKWIEQNYEGHGVFGGKDYYELLAEMNGITNEDTDNLRGRGIDLAFSNGNGSGDGTEGIYYPNLVEKADDWVYEMSGPDSCEFQGCFYDDEDENNDYWDDEEDYEN